jgi:microcystin-dependent protein
MFSNKSLMLIIVTLINYLFLTDSISGQIPRTFSIQGLITRTDTNKLYNDIVTSLYVGSSNVALFTQKDTVKIGPDGLFQITLGKNGGIPDNIVFDRQYFIEFKVNENIFPIRLPLQASPYALMSEQTLNVSGVNSGDISIGTSNGLFLSGQVLSLNEVSKISAGAMTQIDKIKLDRIEEGAEVNINADWNSTAGDGMILNKPFLGTMSKESVNDYYTKLQVENGFQQKDQDLQTIATIGQSNQLLRVKNDGTGLEWFTPFYLSSYTESDPQVGIINLNSIPRWDGTTLISSSIVDIGNAVTITGTIQASNLSGTNTGDIVIGNQNGLLLTGQTLSIDTAKINSPGVMSQYDKTKLNSIASGAEVNVNADWNATTGDGLILNKPNLGSMAFEIINNYYKKTQADTVFQSKDQDLTTIAAIGNANQQIKVKNDGSGLEWFTPNQSTSSNPVGTIISFAGSTAPSGYLVCDGSEISRATYADLFSVLGTTWGAGNGTTTFNIPDLRGQFLRGFGGNTNEDPEKTTRFAKFSGGNTGNNIGTFQSDDFKSHRHYILQDGNGSISGYNFKQFEQDGYGPNNNPVYTDYKGGNETRPKNVYVLYVVKF